MKWIIERPTENEQREKHFFAWIPVYCGNEIRWLERVVVRQVYVGNEWYNMEFLNP